ncbi:hypothetical protein TSUD_98030 [Trifolium subterraneum]|uniref:Uncharacterized protein n=1 Tax=Trifolium subterraneum TaxID=3900 RepID=A0A2Z6LW88_TRISU|nr:hypothetical protein TSUD_98030 [Trifolium subterraneum]
MGTELLDNLKAQYEKPNGTQVVTISERESQEASLGGDTMKVTPTIEKISGLGDMVSPNTPRPPNLIATPLMVSSVHHNENMEMDNEIFEDANDQGSV